MTYRDRQDMCGKSFTEGDQISNLIDSIKETKTLCEEEWRVVEMVEVNRISQSVVRRLPGKEAPFFFSWVNSRSGGRSETSRRMRDSDYIEYLVRVSKGDYSCREFFYRIEESRRISIRGDLWLWFLMVRKDDEREKERREIWDTYLSGTRTCALIRAPLRHCLSVIGVTA
jgi:hypothetical protein